MPIAVDMSSLGSPGPLSPTSPRTTKAAFFRARSPPIFESRIKNLSSNGNHTNNNRNELTGGFDLQARMDPVHGRYTPESSSDGHSRDPPSTTQAGLNRNMDGGYSSSTVGSTSSARPLDPMVRISPTRQASSSSQLCPSSPRALLAGYKGAMAAVNGHDETLDEFDKRLGSTQLREGAVMGIAGGSDEMLMTLLAGQAAVDCEKLPVGGWEEVESWKKELTLLSTRLESLVSRHQREVKILTAARTLQKLNNANKRMSKQTMESLEQSEKRAEAAEKEVLVLRDREAALRRQLMEHWAGVMAWEVRRLEYMSSETSARMEHQARRTATDRTRHDEMARRVASMEEELSKRSGRTAELEEMVLEMGRRERVIEDEARELDKLKGGFEKEKEAWERERRINERDKEGWEEEKRGFEEERQGWQMEKRMLQQDREAVVREKQKALDNGRMSDRDRAMLERVRGGLGGILGRKGGVGEAEMVDAVEDVRRLLERREDEVARLKEEMREVNMGLEEEVRRVSADRDLWKAKVDKAEKSGSLKATEITALERRLGSQGDQISDLTLRNESLTDSLNAAQSAVSSFNSTNDTTRSLQRRVDSLTAELDSIAGQFNEIWSILPLPSRRADAELVDAHTGLPNFSISSPSRAIDVAALQKVYQSHDESFAGIAEMINRVRGMVDDGKLLVDRVVRLGQERELLKTNAARAKKLAEDSRAGLETYQQQVALLEDQLGKTGASESKFLDELNFLRNSLDKASASKRQLEIQITKANETVDRLTQANDTLSSRTLSMAGDAEQEKKALQRKIQDEMDDLKRRLEDAQEEVDEGRTRGQAQRIQLLDELNSLQAENAEMRKQLRAAQRGGTPSK